MRQNTNGLILKEQNIGEQDKLVPVLTSDLGVIKAFVRGAKSIKSKKQSATGLLCYSKLSLYNGKDSYIIDEAQPIEVFFGLRNDIEKLALAQYFAELAYELAPQETDANEYLRVVLNSLYMLSNGKKNAEQLKAITELRLLSLSGYMPNLICCDGCACYEHEMMYFLPEKGIIVCGDCIGNYNQHKILTGSGVTHAMRHCIYSEFKKLFAFNLTKDAQPVLEYASEEYIHSQINRKFKTLEFYRSIKS